MTNLNRPRYQVRTNWIWLAVIVAFALAFLFVIANPSGQTDEESDAAQTGDVGEMAPANVPDTQMGEIEYPIDDTIVTRIEDETAAEAATPAD